jgi:methionine synthase II (cobalamin-independent)
MRPLLTNVGSLPPMSGPPDELLESVVELQRAHGMDLLTDGEQRGDMLSFYTEIPGIREGPGVPRIVDRIHPMEDPARFLKVRNLDRLRSLFPGAAFKVALTGPATFLLACAAGGAGASYRGPMDPTLHDELTEALRPIAHEIGRRGAHLQLDEPILSQGMRDYGPALHRLDLLASEVPRDRASLHVCGGLARAKTLDALVRLTRIPTLSLAFAGKVERENRALLTPRFWEEHDFRLGAGCIDVQVSRAEEVMEPKGVTELLREIEAGVGPEHLAFVHPDCGLRGTPVDLVPALLTNLRLGFAEVFPPDA